ncbi:MAG: bifunctional methylenetetrahydrofolate dehydrogenase/methenyltetrahydrofolate cyclohydrolase FolD [Xanthomonadaceae bacterium]|nr:bifunctional methylenetetrahydrofolate dehydrogenase/methenyltetrahydrofolate cyclohydrolase FolD [Xanthomonadaceae bacterium]
MTATIIDGRAVAERLRKHVSERTAELARRGTIPGLAVVLVGDDAASQVYVASKTKQAAAVGIQHFDFRLPTTTTTEALIELVRDLNARRDVHGILVQLPLPKHVDADTVLAAIDPAKDVDGFHAVNAGKLVLGQETTVPCTPLGCLILIREARSNLAGLRALVIGRSNIVGKPMAHLLLQHDCTVTIAHSRTRDLPAICGEADIVVAAIGRPRAIAGEWLKHGATVIDVGINRVDAGGGKTKLVGDVDFETAAARAGAITPVPGGVGPMTIACLLVNTLNAAVRAAGSTGVATLNALRPEEG